MKKLYLLFVSVACMALAGCGNSAPQEFTITWKNYDETVLATDIVKVGVKPEYKGETPKRESTAEQTFTFDGWTPKVVEAKENATYTATYKEDARKYAITFLAGEYEGKKGKFSDGKDSKVYYIPYGTIPSGIEIPVVEPTPTEEYPFKDWGEELEKVTEDKTYTATYTKDDRHFNIVFDANGGYFDGDKTKTKITHRIKYTDTYEDKIPSNPSRDDTAQYKYKFSKWDPEEPTGKTPPTEDITYTAQWDSETQNYEITYNAGEGHFDKEESKTTYTETLPYGDLPNPEMPIAKEHADENKAYIFTGWNPEISKVTANKIYTAKYEEVDLQILNLTYVVKDERADEVNFSYDGLLTSVNWGDGTINQENEHKYKEAKEYRIVIKGIFNRVNFSLNDYITEATYTGAWGTINNYAFYSCKGLEKVTFDSPSIKKIENSAFNECSKLSCISFGNSEDSINEIEYNAFNECNDSLYTETGGVRYIKINDNQYYVADKYVAQNDSDLIQEGCVIIADSFNQEHKDESYRLLDSFPASVKWIGADAFSNINVTDSFKLGFKEGLKGIHRYAFYYNSGLVGVTLPESLEYIGDDAFTGCDNLRYYTEASCNYLGNAKNNYLVLMKYSESRTFKCNESCNLIAPGAFENNAGKVTTLNIPKHVKYIGTSLFSNNNRLTSVTVDIENKYYSSPDNSNAIIETASKTLVLGCSNTNIPNDTRHIADYAFYGCSDFTYKNIPDTVLTLGYNSFGYCSKLANVYIPRLTINIAYNAFDSSKEIGYLSVNPYNPIYDSHDNCNAIIRSSDKTKELVIGTKNTIIPKDITIIGSNSFKYTDIKEITIPEGVETIGSFAFGGCTLLSKITLPKTLRTIASYTFIDCPALKSIFIPQNVTEMDEFVFLGNNEGKKATITVYCEAKSKPEKWKERWEWLDHDGALTLTKIGAVEWNSTPSNLVA